MSLKKRTKRINTDKSYPQLTFEQALDMAISAKKAEGLRDRTIKDYEKHYGYFVMWLRENHPEAVYIDDVTTATLRDFVLYMKHDARRYYGHKYIESDKQRIGLTDTTINIRLRTLKALFNQLERDELIEINPAGPVKLMRQDLDLTNGLTDEEVTAILAQPDRRDFVGFRDYVAICLMLDSGLRISEMLSLRAADIDFQTRFITLPGDRNKNRKPRLVPISAQVAKLLLQLIDENRAHFTTDRLFLSCYGDPVTANHFNKRLKYYGEKAGIEGKKMTAHVYRHTWARSMVLNGADLFTLQKMGGWQDVRTMRRYVQMDTRDVRLSHDQNTPINKFIRKKGPQS
ncbi:tyrosine recombinase XerC [Paenibacillus sp. JCM 10914]|uniref:tyrosine-type recombinase/integrase n=1 Tax=Paenibacillus sp. JCM 10914 TaxID=1236974 RepID=UPI0003CC8AD4|nr:tyrosine-type recombinase/integrase [Paenibacillus sp. JCM 10914]GAE08141.1 phage-related integrase/recombinase [Paenibacillus sp. JCM 10914]